MILTIVLIAALIIKKIPLQYFATDKLPMVGGTILSILLIAAMVAVSGVIYYFVGMFVVGILCFVGVIVLDVLIAVIWPISAIICGIINSGRRRSHQKNSAYLIEKCNREFEAKYASKIEKELEFWESQKFKYDKWLKEHPPARRKTPEEKRREADAYYKEVARIAATSKPILTTILDDLDVIKTHVVIIKTEYKNLCKGLDTSNINEDAFECYNLIKSGEVDTYQQAIAMQKNLADANLNRAIRRREEEERKRQQEREWQKIKQEEERIKEEKRKEEEKIARIENALRDVARIQRDQTIATVAAALAEVKKINEQNETIEEAMGKINEQNDLIEENNRLLADIKRNL